MLLWLPAKLSLSSSGVTRYACRVLADAGAWDRLCIVSLIHGERRIRAEGGDSWLYLAACNRPPRLLWKEFPGGEYFVAPLKRKATDLFRTDFFTLLTTRGGPLSGCAPRRLRACLENPARTARLGYLCCLRAARHEGLGAHVVEGKFDYQASAFSKSLTLIALGSLGMQLQHRCERCFRQAVAGLRRCSDHSQSHAASTEDGKSVHQRRVNARAAAKLVRLVGDVGTSRDLEAAKLSRASQLFGALFDLPIGDAERWRGAMQDALQAAPTVRTSLPAAFDLSAPRPALRALRRRLDPLEYDPWAWPDKIRHADTWLANYKEIAPGKPPSGPRRKTLERMAEVRRLRSQGLDEETIARKLGVSARAIGLMFKRHGP